MIYVLLPAFNEEQSLKRLIPAISLTFKKLSEPFEIIVVNDGSRDQTSMILDELRQSLPVREIKHETNLGYGAALRSGYHTLLAHEKSPDAIVVSLDADETHDPIYIPVMVNKVREGFDAVMASFTMPGGSYTGIPRYRALMSLTVNFLFRICCPVQGTDTYSNGFRAYRLGILRTVADSYQGHFIDESGFAGGAELFLKVASCGGCVAEIPFILHYERRGKESKIRFIPTIWGYLKVIWRAKKS